MEVILVDGTNVVSKIIQKLTNGPSHVALRYGEPEAAWLIHSTVGGVQPEWWHSFQAKYPKMCVYQTLFAGAETAADNLVKRLGHAPYDYQGILGQGLAIVFGLKKNPLGNPRAWRCTELLTEWHMECNKVNSVIKIPELDPEMATPKSLMEFWESRPDLFKKKGT